MASLAPPIAPTLRLNQGPKIPQLGLGVFQSPPGEPTRKAVSWALEAGYRHIDTAALYGNEVEVGEAVRASKLPREEVFVTTKLWFSEHGFERAQAAARKSLERLGLGYIDLYLIHWPRADRPQDRLDSWRALEKLQKEGICRAVGVSNYAIRHLEELASHSDLVPATNQVEYHPFVHDPELLKHCQKRGIVVEAWSPLTRGRFIEDPLLGEIARAHGRTPAQVLLRWGIEHGIVVLPKSVHRERIIENGRIFDFELSSAEVARMDALSSERHVGLAGNPKDIP